MENLDLATIESTLNLDQDTINTSFTLFLDYGTRLVSALLVLIAGWIIGNKARSSIYKIKKLDSTLKSFLGGLAKYIILAVALVTVLGQFGVQTASLLAVLGAAGLAIGLALQGTLSNVASGVMLLILRPFNVGDYVEASGIGGSVKDLGLFTTELSTPDNVYIAVPNSRIWNSEIKNYSRNNQRRQDIVMGISYDDDIEKAFKTLTKVVNKEKRLVTTKEKKPQIMVSSYGDSSVNITVRVWSATKDFWDVKFDLNKALKEALDSDGITIPFPTRTIEYAEPPKATAKKPANSSKKSSGKKKAA
ncbi:MAG: mechanosensitive ion channel domain-containing protein [Pseudomonadota bacterium]